MVDGINKFMGMNKSIYMPEYQKMLNDRTNSIFGDQQTISKKELLQKDDAVMEAYLKLDENGRKNFDKILSMSDDGNTVNIVEYKTLLTVLDSEELEHDNPMLMDGNFSVDSKQNGIYTLDINKDIEPLMHKITLEGLENKEQKLKYLNKVLDEAVYGKPRPAFVDEHGNEYWTGCKPPLTKEAVEKIISTACRFDDPDSNDRLNTSEILESYFGKNIEPYRPKGGGARSSKYFVINENGEKFYVEMNIWNSSNFQVSLDE